MTVCITEEKLALSQIMYLFTILDDQGVLNVYSSAWNVTWSVLALVDVPFSSLDVHEVCR